MAPNVNIEMKLKNYSLYDDVYLEPSQLEIVQKEIGESPESREECLQLLRKSLTECEDLHPCLEDNFLLWFLRVSKFDPKKALARIQKYYTSQEKYLNVFKKYPMTVTEAQKYRYYRASPYRMKNNSPVFFSKPAIVDYSKLPFESKLYLDTIFTSKWITNPVTQMCGANLVIDMEGFHLQTLMAHSLGRCRFMAEMLLVVLPVRVRSIHFVNTTAVFPTLYRFAKPLFPKKVQQRVFIHPNDDEWKSLHSFFPREILPEDFGGDMKQSGMVDMFENVEEYEISFREQLRYGFKATETLRSTWTGITLTNK